MGFIDEYVTVWIWQIIDNIDELNGIENLIDIYYKL